jgi:hypothetical protein
MRPRSASLSSPSVDPLGVRRANPTLASVASPLFPGAGDQVGQDAAKRALRGQIARLERDLVEQRCSKWPRPAPDLRVATSKSRPSGPGDARLLAVGELEVLRDQLVATLSAERRALASRTRAESERRRLREELMLDPAAYAGARVRNADVGEGGCGAVRSAPAGGVLGMLMGWWRVVVSSGCPEEASPADLYETGQRPPKASCREAGTTSRARAGAPRCGLNGRIGPAPRGLSGPPGAPRRGLNGPLGAAPRGALRCSAFRRHAALCPPLLRELLLGELPHEVGCDGDINHEASP